MYKNDFILKYVEQLANVIARALGLVGEGKKEEAIEIIDSTLKDINIEEVPVGYFESVADLYKIKGELKEDIELLEKALMLYQKVDAETKTFSFERAQKITEIKQLL